MKNNFLFFSSTLFLFCFVPGFGQTFINGDFENNTAASCEYNLSDSEFNTKISNVFAFGKTYYAGNYAGEADIQTTGCYVTPHSGNWCVGIASDYTLYTTSDAIAVELTSNLSVGQAYQLSFYIFGNTIFSNTTAKVSVGASLADSTFGVFIDSLAPAALVWKQVALSFIASQPSKYITIKNNPGINGWNQIDSLAITRLSGTHNILKEASQIKVFPNPVSDFASIETGDASHFLSATIKTILGATIFTTNNPTIDCTQMQPGIYLIEIKTDKGYYTSRLLKE